MRDGDPCAFVIFGATGNLTREKLVPALFHLECAGRLPEDLAFVACSRRAWDSARLARRIAQMDRWRCAQHGSGSMYAVIERFVARFAMSAATCTTSHLPRLGKSWHGRGPAYATHVVFYLAIKPAEFGTVIQNLDAVGLNKPRGLHRVVVEKPFGEDIESRPDAQRAAAPRISTKSRSSASITIWARKPSRTCWCSASPTR